jgi:hypothetical protein
MIQTLENIQFLNRLVKKKSIERICLSLAKYNKSEVYEDKNTKYYNKIVLSRYTEEEDEILLNLPDFLELRDQSNTGYEDYFTIGKGLLSELSVMRKLSG